MPKFTLLFAIVLILAYTSLASSHALPFQPSISDSILQQPSSNTSAPNEPTLAENVVNLLAKLPYAPDIRVRQATLSLIYITDPTHTQFSTTNPHDLRLIVALFRPYGPDPTPRAGLRDVFTYRNLNNGEWAGWNDKGWFVVTERHWERAHEMQWAALQSMMSIDQANRLLKAAGHRDPFYAIEIGQLDGDPVGYCFLFHPVGVFAVRVDARTREVRVVESQRCSF
ncbi:MAG: hypothetical protein HETSPECPRED_004021 [Heterodermia speciosa]|uniref:Uncharacterized protein n=1 Tax=Heterodermia speciosa TaxID=116794 RepID=A0A8H3IG43_9LECA|nr:MAG: hypothetical protein HETSPECPRED_004021 [Heterodermia speciosa]